MNNLEILKKNCLYLVSSISDEILGVNYTEEINCKIENARNGEKNLILNGIHMYSKYNPSKDVEQFICSQLDNSADSYIICGFGLGYHALKLHELEPNKKIIIFEPNLGLLKFILFNYDFQDLLSNERVRVIFSLSNLVEALKDGGKLIVSISWLNSLEESQLKNSLREYITNTNNMNNNGGLLQKNFLSNQKLQLSSISNLVGKFINKKAILVSAGPSLDETIQYLGEFKNKYFILCVGTAFLTLVKNGINPDAIIITDPKATLNKQIKVGDISIPMFFLSTLNPSLPKEVSSKKYILYQKGFKLSEQYAIKNNIPLIETGGSVATTGFDLLIQLGFIEVILFGQDLAYLGNRSHSLNSSSNTKFNEVISKRVTLSNSGETVKTSTSWLIYKKFFEKKILEFPHLLVYNTSENGAVIKGAKFIGIIELLNKSKIESLTNFQKILDS